MNCGRCAHPFSDQRTPRILTKCGHTLCFLCAKELLSNNSIDCPECASVSLCSRVEDLPLNQALLNMQKQGETKTFTCSGHGRPLEAFCSTDKEVLCVDCILTGTHKNHDISSIATSAKAEKDAVAAMNLKAGQLRVKLVIMREELDRMMAEKQAEFDGLVGELGSLVQLVVSTIKTRENQLIEKFRRQLEENLETNRHRKLAVLKQLAAIEKMTSDSARVDIEPNTETLTKAKSRLSLGLSALTPLEPFPLQQKLVFSKETELNSLFKTLRGILTRSVAGKKPRSSPNSSFMNTSHPSFKLDTSDTIGPSSPSPWTKQTQIKVSVSAMNSPIRERNEGHVSLSQQCSPVSRKKVTSPQSLNISIKTSSLHNYLKRLQSKVPKQESKPGLKSMVRDSILVFGGFSERLTQVEVYHPDTNSWTQSATLNKSRSYFGSAVYEDRILLLGGKIEGIRTADCEVVRLGMKKGEESEVRLTSARSSFACVQVAQDIYIAGGNEGIPLRKMETFNGKTWKPLANLKQKREDFALVLGPDLRLFALGGFGGPDNAFLSSCEVYNIVEDRWSPMPGLHSARRGLSAVSLPSGIYAIGGYDGTSHLNTMERFDYVKNEWKNVGKMMHSRSNFSAVASSDGKFVYVFGGFNGNALSVVEQYSVNEDKWRVVNNLPSARFLHGSVCL